MSLRFNVEHHSLWTCCHRWNQIVSLTNIGSRDSVSSINNLHTDIVEMSSFCPQVFRQQPFGARSIRRRSFRLFVALSISRIQFVAEFSPR